jgi:putative sterol carrier protein
VAKYPFLSDEWFTEVGKLVTEHGPQTSVQTNVLVNLVVTDTPFDSNCEFHMGSQDGAAAFGLGHADGADVTLTTDYGTAKEVFVSGNPQAGMQAFMAGKVKVSGDMTKLMMAQQGGMTAGNPDLESAIKDVTE